MMRNDWTLPGKIYLLERDPVKCGFLRLYFDRAPEAETEYVTYSSLFGYQKATRFVLILTWADIMTNFLLVWNLNRIAVLLLLLNVLWMTWKFLQFLEDPSRFPLVDKVERYTYIQESLMLLTIPVYLLFGRI